MKEGCIFCDIIEGKVPCYKIAENEQAIAFLDIANDSYGHTLVIPKLHFENVMDCDDVYLCGVQKLVKEVANHYVKNCGFEGVDIANASGEAAGQTVFHLHYHIFPRKAGDKFDIVYSSKDKPANLEKVHEALEIKPMKKIVATKKDTVILFTDGACSNNPGIGGYAAILTYKGKEKVISGGEQETTNNRMELMGAIKGLQAVKNGCKVEVYSDSAYLINAFEQGWIESWQKNKWRTSAKSQVINMDLWLAILEQTKRLDITWNKVKGHADNEYNNRCDEIARGEVEKIKAKVESEQK